FFFSSRRRHTIWPRDWSSDVCSSDLPITVFDPHMKLPTVHEWNFSLQRELPGKFVMQAAYIGRRGERLFMAYDANQINANAIVRSEERRVGKERSARVRPVVEQKRWG